MRSSLSLWERVGVRANKPYKKAQIAPFLFCRIWVDIDNYRVDQLWVSKLSS